MCDVLLVVYEVVRYALSWLLEYPVLTASLAAFVLIAWNRLGGGLGLNDLFWNRDRRTQFLIGMGTGAACGHILHVRYLVRGVPTPDGWAAWWHAQLPSLNADSESGAIRTLGQYLCGLYVPLLVVLALPALRDIRGRWLLPAGLAASVGVYMMLTIVAEREGWLGRVNEDLRVANQVLRVGEPAAAPVSDPAASPALEPRTVLDPDTRRPYTLLLVLTTVFALACLVFVIWEWWPRIGTPPPVLPLVAMLGLFNAFYGIVSLREPGFQYLFWVSVAAWGWWANRNPFKLRLPNLDDKWHVSPADLNAALPTTCTPVAAGATVKVTAAEILKAAATRWSGVTVESQEPKPPEKPPLVVLAVSGGGSRSAVWTCAVLEELRRRAPLLADNVRLVTGASGGMVGAAYYASYWAANPAGKAHPLPAGIERELIGCNFAFASSNQPQVVDLYAPLARALSRDALSPVVSSMLLRDLPCIFWPRVVSRDRGTALEDAWKRNTKIKGGSPSDSPFALPLVRLADAERKALIPSLLFSPMLVEDARRLLISNLDLAHLCEVTLPNGGQLSCPAVEFHKLFPGADKFEIGTAARIQASFPFVSPAVTLPTRPMRRVVDAGYYDNYGVDLATEWLYHNRTEVVNNSSGVLLLEVRGYKNDERRKTAVIESDDGSVESDDGSFAWLRSPLTAVLAMRERSPWYRNDERLRGVAGLLDTVSGKIGFMDVRSIEFPGTPRSAPLGWSMTDDQRQELIVRAQQVVDRLLLDLRSTTYPWLPVLPPNTLPPH